MNRIQWFVITVVVMLYVPATLRAGEASPEREQLLSILENITSEEEAVRRQAFEEVRRMGARGVEQLIRMLAELGEGKDAGVRFALHGLAAHVIRPGAEVERAAFARVLCEQLERDLPVRVKQFLLRQLQIAGREESVPALAECLTKEELAETARQALLANPTAAALDALRAALPQARDTLRLGLIQALGQRRDRGSGEALMAEASSPQVEVRIAALEALGQIGEVRAEPIIVAALDKGTSRERRAAFDACLRLGAQLLGAEEHEKALELYTRALERAPSNYHRRAALLALGKVRSADAARVALPYMSDAQATVRLAAAECLARIPNREVAGLITAALKRAEPPLRAALLRVLARRKEPQAAEAIAAARRDANAEVRVTAFYLRGELADPALEPTLLEAAKAGSDFIHPIALEAYLKLAQARLDRKEKDAALAMFTRALELARTTALRRAALRGLAAVGSTKSLPIVRPLLEDEAVRGEALRAYVAIAAALAAAGERTRAIEMLQETVRMRPPREVAEGAVRKLRELGVKIDPAREAGFVTCWWIIGPFPGQNVDREFPPEKGVELEATLKVDDRELRWVKHHTADLEGIVNLIPLMEPNQNTTAYLYAEVTVEQAQEVLFKIGSDDGVKFWLNGKLLHRFPRPRSLRVDQDVIRARLEAGLNRLLLKVVNGGGGWASCLRITDLTGKTIKFEQREE